LFSGSVAELVASRGQNRSGSIGVLIIRKNS
jgi:hypothetical protein